MTVLKSRKPAQTTIKVVIDGDAIDNHRLAALIEQALEAKYTQQLAEEASAEAISQSLDKVKVTNVHPLVAEAIVGDRITAKTVTAEQLGLGENRVSINL